MEVRELKIEVYPKSKRRIYFNGRGSLSNLNDAVRNLYEQVVQLKIELPKMDSYPLFELSNPKANFEEAELNYPELSGHFEILRNMQAIYFRKDFQCRRFLDSMCITQINGKHFLEIIVIYPNSFIDEVIDFFDRMGIDSSSIKQ